MGQFNLISKINNHHWRRRSIYSEVSRADRDAAVLGVWASHVRSESFPVSHFIIQPTLSLLRILISCYVKFCPDFRRVNKKLNWSVGWNNIVSTVSQIYVLRCDVYKTDDDIDKMWKPQIISFKPFELKNQNAKLYTCKIRFSLYHIKVIKKYLLNI